MSPESEDPDPTRRAEQRWYVLVALAVFGVGVAAWQPLPAGVWHDDGVYMLVGKALADGHGLHYAGVAGSPPAVKFPPLYPLVLAALWSLLGTIGPVTLAANILGLALLAAGAALFARALHNGAGLPVRLAAAVAALSFASVDVVRTALVPLSEPLFLALTMAALALWGPVGRDERPTRASHLLLAAALLGAVMARTAGVALLVAFVLALLLRRRFRTALVVATPALLAAAGWGAWAAARMDDIPEGMRDLLGGYGGWLVAQLSTAPGAFASRLPEHTLGVLERMAWLALPGLSGPALWWAALPLGVLAVLGLASLFRKLPPAAWWMLGYLAVLLLWPYHDRRLMVPLHPFVMAAVALGALQAYGWLQGEGAWRTRIAAARPAWIVAGAVLLWAGAYGVVTASRYATGWDGAAYQLRARQLATAVEALRTTAPADAVVGAPEFWAALHLHGGWTVAPSARFSPRDADPDAPVWGTPAEQLALWREAGITHLLLEQAATVHGAALDLLEARCPGAVEILATMPPMMVVQISTAPHCRS